MIRRTIGLLLCAVVATTFALTLAGPTAAHDSVASAMTERVLDHHLKAFGEADIASILEDYTADSVMITPNRPIYGADQLRPVFESLFAEFAKPGAVFEMTQRVIEGEVAYIVWTAETADNVYELGTDTLVVKDGKIAVQTFTGKITPKNYGVFRPT
jgi:ketosteroid isomerase-like protein